MKFRWIIVGLLCLAGCNLSIDPTPNLRPAPAATKTLSGLSAEFITEATPNPNTAGQTPLTPPIIQASHTPTTPCEIPNGWTEYAIKRGDTLSTIATRANTTLDTLVQANCLTNPNALKVGQILRLPPSLTATP